MTMCVLRIKIYRHFTCANGRFCAICCKNKIRTNKWKKRHSANEREGQRRGTEKLKKKLNTSVLYSSNTTFSFWRFMHMCLCVRNRFQLYKYTISVAWVCVRFRRVLIVHITLKPNLYWYVCLFLSDCVLLCMCVRAFVCTNKPSHRVFACENNDSGSFWKITAWFRFSIITHTHNLSISEAYAVHDPHRIACLPTTRILDIHMSRSRRYLSIPTVLSNCQMVAFSNSVLT